MARLQEAPVTAAQSGWPAWEARLGDELVKFGRFKDKSLTSFSRCWITVWDGNTSRHVQRFMAPDIQQVRKCLAEDYGRQDTAESSEWTLREIFPFFS